ncbi:hypothetical protein BDA99DRAFT_437357 [Phascolomyces articulosus]|uniref:PARP-type domain-containing protein n=1 Tax=Phascolomyces articulosus TaxID=60185 RepID=A0AAD5KBY6_9FUNG|nr:hypothetical protein BDA99DRAFT_437357 [Phascolomyces articulosus]
MSEKEETGITTYCIEYAKFGKADCSTCGKVIPHHSLRAGEIFRKSKSEKKKSAKHSWYHFNCWKVPELVTKLPIEQFRGYPSLKEKDQKRVQRVIEKGVGATWTDVSEKPLPSKQDQEQDEALEQQVKGEEKKENDNKKSNPKNKKQETNKKRKRQDDMTAQLTGVTQPKKTKKNNKKEKEQQQPEPIKLAKEDQLELESLAKQIQAVTKKMKL